jgi:hypothetical protein
MKLLATILTLLTFVAVGGAQTSISSFPYTYNWSGASAFTKGSSAEYIGADGHWATYAVNTKPQWAPDASGNFVSTNAKNNSDLLFCNVDATGKSFSGAEVFTFEAMKSGGNPTGSVTVQIGTSTVLTLDVATNLSTSFQPFSAPIPVSLSNTSFKITITVNTNGVVSVDNTSIHGGVLPITLSSFKLNLLAETPVLTWTTISEIDNYGFYVQKSQDNVTWVDIMNSFQKGYGTTIETHSYSFTDNTLPVGNYYRLHQVDLNGTNHYSDAIAVVASVQPETAVREFALNQNYPNPFNPSTRIKYTVGGTGISGLGTSKTSLIVYDMLGREVAVLVNEQKAPGSYQVQFDGSGLASGVYIYRLTAGSFTDTKRMVLMK